MTARASEIVVVPLKDFGRSKSRLRNQLGDDGANNLARQLASAVIAATQPRECLVVCDDDEVESFALQRGARVHRTLVSGLSASVSDALSVVRENFDMMIVAHGDLGHPEGLGSAPFDDAVTIVTDRHGTGTNVLAVPTATDFAFSYGPGSAARHLAEAIRRHGRVRVMTDSPWSLDIDEPDDFQILTM